MFVLCVFFGKDKVISHESKRERERERKEISFLSLSHARARFPAFLSLNKKKGRKEGDPPPPSSSHPVVERHQGLYPFPLERVEHPLVKRKPFLVGLLQSCAVVAQGSIRKDPRPRD